MVKLFKQSILIFITTFILTFAMFFFSVSRSHAGYDATTANNNHTGFYLGAGTGIDIPSGPDEDGYGAGISWTGRLGYQFIRNLAIEGSFHESLGSFNQQDNTSPGAPSVVGDWIFADLSFLDLKPIIPLNLRNNLYFIVGIAFDGFIYKTYNLSPNTTISSFGLGYDLGMGYEGYITNHISLGGELVYHNFTNNRFAMSSNGQNESVTTPYNINMSFTSLNFSFLYHF
jgi:Outer membrane protein beta-barrel domain